MATRYLSVRCGVKVFLLTTPERIRTEEARENLRTLAGTEAELHVADKTSALAGLSDAIAEADVIVAAIFGTG